MNHGVVRVSAEVRIRCANGFVLPFCGCRNSVFLESRTDEVRAPRRSAGIGVARPRAADLSGDSGLTIRVRGRGEAA